ICQSCNNGWMRQVDEDAEDVAVNLALGYYDRIRTDERLPLALSLARACLMRQWGERARTPFPTSAFSELFESRMPPTAMTIFVGRSDFGRIHAGGHSAVLHARLDDGDEPLAVVTSFSLGWLFVVG